MDHRPKYKTIKLLENTQEKSLCDLKLDKDFLDMIPRTPKKNLGWWSGPSGIAPD
jgi:hypothetical protein